MNRSQKKRKRSSSFFFFGVRIFLLVMTWCAAVEWKSRWELGFQGDLSTIWERHTQTWKCTGAAVKHALLCLKWYESFLSPCLQNGFFFSPDHLINWMRIFKHKMDARSWWVKNRKWVLRAAVSFRMKVSTSAVNIAYTANIATRSFLLLHSIHRLFFSLFLQRPVGSVTDACCIQFHCFRVLCFTEQTQALALLKQVINANSTARR